MQARLILEPEIARLAALRSSGEQVAELRKMCQAIRAATTWDEYDDLDWHFHNALAEASNNTLLLELQQVLNGVRRVVVKNVFRAHSPGPPADFSAFDEHDAIVWAIDQRDGPYAHETMRRHLATTAELYEQ